MKFSMLMGRIIGISIVVVCLVVPSLLAQDLENYSPLRSSGIIPKHITRLSKSKTE